MKICGAVSSDLFNWKTTKIIKGINNSGVIISDYLYDDDRVMYLAQKKNIQIAYSKDLVNWQVEKNDILKTRADMFDSVRIIPANVRY